MWSLDRLVAFALSAGTTLLAAQQPGPHELEGYRVDEFLNQTASNLHCSAGTFALGMFQNGPVDPALPNPVPAHECAPTATLILTVFADTVRMIQQELATVPVDSASQLWASYSASLTKRLGRLPDAVRWPSINGPLEALQALWVAADSMGWFAAASFQVLKMPGGVRSTASLLVGSCAVPILPRPGLCTSSPP